MAITALNIEDLRQAARRRLPNGLFEYIDRSTEDDVAVRANRSAFEAIHLAPRALVDVSRRNLGVDILGTRLPMPLAISPAGPAGLFWYRGEEELAHAARAFGVPYGVSSYCTVPLDVLARTGATLWCQLYIWNDRRISERIVERAEASGVKVILLTIDTAAVGQREYLHRNGFAMPFRLTRRAAFDILRHPSWAMSVPLRYRLARAWPRSVNLEPAAIGLSETPPDWGERTTLAQDVTWDEVARLRERWPHKLVIKGILRPEDAERAAALGCDGIVVSNHGGRHLDSAMPAIWALADIAPRVKGRLTILFDSGIRRGSDIVKALTLGADAVLAGRPMLFAVGANGRQGAIRALELLHEEMERTMILSGAARCADLTRDLIAPQAPRNHSSSEQAL